MPVCRRCPLKRLDRYFSTQGKADDVRKINILLYLCGKKGEQIFESAHLTGDDAKVYAKVKKIFEDYYHPWQNIFYHRAMLLRWMQSGDESVESFIADCYKIAAHCNYGAESDNMLRDRIASGLFNGKLRDELIFFGTSFDP